MPGPRAEAGTTTFAGPAGRAQAGRRRSLWLAGLALVALVALAYRPVVLSGETFVERDALRFTQPSREFLVGALRALRIPEWYDGVAFGGPFAANPVHEVFAPLGWTMALLPVPQGFDLYNLLHVLIGGLGIVALARRLGASVAASTLAAAALALGGYTTSMVPSGLAPALAWLPWVGWAADRVARGFDRDPHTAAREARMRAGALLAAALALQLLAGEPASLLLAAALTGLLVLVRAARRAAATAAVALAGLGALALAAVAVVPGALLLAASARGAGLDAGGLEFSLHPARLIELVWPMAFGSQLADGWFAGILLRDAGGDPFWSFSLFVGLPLVLCAAAAWRERQVRWLLLAGLAFLVLAAGPYTPAYPLLMRVFPPLRWVNFPEKFVYGALLLGTVAAAIGLGRILAEGASRRLRIAALVAPLPLAIGTLAIALQRTAIEAALSARAAELHYLLNADAGVGAAIRGGAAATGGALLFALGLSLRWRAPRAASVLIGLGIVGPVVWATALTTPFAPRSTVAGTPAILRPIVTSIAEPEAPRPRLFRLDPVEGAGPFRTGAEIARHYQESIETNIAARFGIAVLPGFEPGESDRMRRFGREVFPQMGELAFVRLLGVEWIAVSHPDRLRVPFREVARASNGWASLAAGPVRPRAFVTHDWRVAPDAERSLGSLTIPGREQTPWVVTIVGAAPPAGGPSGAAETLTPCTVRTPYPERVELDCVATARGYAVLLDQWMEGWSATVDGRPTEILLADGLFRAVAVDAGAHTVAFRYRTPGLRVGLAISAVAWLSWLAVTLAPLWRRPGATA